MRFFQSESPFRRCPWRWAAVLAVVTAAVVAAESEPAGVPSASARHNGALRALDLAIDRYETLVGKIDDPKVAVTARAFLASYRERRRSLQQSYDSVKYDELRFDVNVESHRLVQWLAPARTPPSPRKSAETTGAPGSGRRRTRP